MPDIPQPEEADNLPGLIAAVRGLDDTTRRLIKVRTRWVVLGGAAVVLAMVAAFAGGLFLAYHRIDDNTGQLVEMVQADCPQHRALGEGPVQPWTQPLGRDLVRYNRAAYQKKCLGKDNFGPLKPPDPDLSRPIQPSPTPTR